MRHKLQTNVEKRLVMTLCMQQGLSILQMPQTELSQFLQEEIDKNPLLEQTKRRDKPTFDLEIASATSTHENLLNQIRENFSEKKDRLIAKKMLEYLDEKGFLSTSLIKIAENIDEPIFRVEETLKTLQTFDPPGIFARNLQESLLIQLRKQGRENTPVYSLVRDHYSDLLHGRYSLLKKKCASLDLSDAIQKLIHLQMRPMESFKNETVCPIVADIFIRKTDTGWVIGALEDDLPKFSIHNQYQSIKPSSEEEKKNLQDWLSQGKNLLNALSRRKEILLQIGLLLARHQSQYLDQKGNLVPLTIEDLKTETGLHESTLSRALSGKYVETPRGLIPLRSLLTASPKTKKVKEILQEIVSREDPTNPLTDDQLSSTLKKKGFLVARRTISKYRKELKIRSAQTRKHVR